MRLKKLLYSALLVGVLATSFGSTAMAQPGITEPLRTPLMGIRHGSNMDLTVSPWDIYMFKIEPVINANNQPMSVAIISTGGIYYPLRSLRFPKEEYYYAPVNWAGVQGPGTSGTYFVYALVNWPAGKGAVSGRQYSAGGTILILPVTVTN